MTRCAPYCALPWQQMIIDVNGNVGCCGGMGNSRSLGNLKNQAIMEVWNGEAYRNVRHNLQSGNKEGAGCMNCIAEKLNIMPDLNIPAEPSTGFIDCDFSRNIKLLKEDYSKGNTYLKAKPTIISYSGTYECNYKCIMCYQETLRHSRLISTYASTATKVLKELNENYPYLSQLMWGGGEPFLQKECLEFISSFKPEDNPYLCFAVTTNGSLINEMLISWLKKFYEVILNFSIDAGSKEIYETVRVNGKWDTIMENLARAARIRQERKGWRVDWNFTAIKSNVKEIPKAMEVAYKYAVPITVNPVISHPIQHLLTCYNDYEKETDGWEFALRKAENLSLSLDYIKKTGCNCNLQIKRLQEMVNDAKPVKHLINVKGIIKGLGSEHCIKYQDLLIVYCNTLNYEPRWYAKLDEKGMFSLMMAEGSYEVRVYLEINDFDIHYLYSVGVELRSETDQIDSLIENKHGIHNFCNEYSKTDRFVCRAFRKASRANRLFRMLQNNCLPRHLEISHQITGADTQT